MDRSPLHTLFNPSSVAVFGASENASSVGARVFGNLLAGGFDGPVIPINPKYQTVAGHRCFPTLAAAARRVDLAVIATPAHTVPAIISDCAKAETKSAIVLSAGFGEGGISEQGLMGQLRDEARRGGVRLLGPNCVGLVRPWLGLDATFLSAMPPKGGLALVSQSGALCSAIADWAKPHHLGFSALVSLGNSLDVGFGDAVRFLANDPETNAILLYVEGVRDASSFISALRGAARSKPVVVLKSGRHGQSSKAAQTHTGALMGDDAVFDAALARTGAVRAVTFGQLFAAAEVLSANSRASGNRLGIITNGGGAGVLAADRAGDLGIDLAEPSDSTLTALDKTLSAYWSRGNPIDILGDATPQQYEAAVRAALADPNFDGVLVMLTPQAMTDATSAAEAVIQALPEHGRKPVLACWMGETAVSAGRNLLSGRGVPDFTTPERAVEAFSYLAQQQRNREMALEMPGPLAEDVAPDLARARKIIEGALEAGRTMLSDRESKAVLSAFGVPVNATIEASNVDAAVAAATKLGFPVAVKIHSPQIIHKSDVGGVRVGITNAEETRQAFDEIVTTARAARPQAEILGVTVEAMARIDDVRELVIGASRDPVFGPVILFGAGGTMVEVLRDSAVSLPPLNRVLSGRLIAQTRVAQAMGTFRDKQAVDKNAVCDVLVRVSELVCELPEVIELDINPLFAGPNGVVAVDARIGIAPLLALDKPYDHVAIHPYPRHLATRHPMPDGRSLLIRPIRPEDAESEAAFVRELSAQARRFRFMGTFKELDRKMLARLTQIDYRREMALIALIDEEETSSQVGVARYAINPDETSCEFALVVSDRVRNQGIGTTLMKALISNARDRGLTRMEATVLSGNAPMLELMAELGFDQSTRPDDPDVVTVTCRL